MLTGSTASSHEHARPAPRLTLTRALDAFPGGCLRTWLLTDGLNRDHCAFVEGRLSSRRQAKFPYARRPRWRAGTSPAPVYQPERAHEQLVHSIPDDILPEPLHRAPQELPDRGRRSAGTASRTIRTGRARHFGAPFAKRRSRAHLEKMEGNFRIDRGRSDAREQGEKT